MSRAKHLKLLFQSVVIWALFWIGGLPDYYQQYSTKTLGVACTILSVLISLAALRILLRSKPENRTRRAFWCSLYYTVTFGVLDYLYCGLYLGYGAGYLEWYWYLTVFYVTPWLTFIPTARLLQARLHSST
ncbi:MAG: hypothetical protein ING68_02695 [Rhodocyclaceae bacterium]|jgi:hypothetical protein|nr:hypothetical protein [Rhodocyclaceae bacterium]